MDPESEGVYRVGPRELLVKGNRVMKSVNMLPFSFGTELHTLPGPWKIVPWGFIIRTTK